MLTEATQHELEKKVAEVEAQAKCGGSKNKATCMNRVTEPKISWSSQMGCCKVNLYTGSVGASAILRE
jgi:hypothetical protein